MNHSCAIVAGGQVRCWGSGHNGRLGDGSFRPISAIPVSVSGLTGATAIAAGIGHTCAVVSDGQVQCWGWNMSGQLGDGTNTNYAVIPTTVTGLTGATAIAAGLHTCATVSGGHARCWGDNDTGQLGDGTTTASRVPVAVNGLSGSTAIAAGYSSYGPPYGGHACAVGAGGEVRCWGLNSQGQLGNGTYMLFTTSPVTVLL
jgi:hypothetical protein